LKANGSVNTVGIATNSVGSSTESMNPVNSAKVPDIPKRMEAPEIQSKEGG